MTAAIRRAVSLTSVLLLEATRARIAELKHLGVRLFAVVLAVAALSAACDPEHWPA